MTIALPVFRSGLPAPESHSSSLQHGFTRLDLVFILGVLALLALMLLPAFARTQTDSRAFQCLNNHRQLARAMRMYADDNADRLPIQNSTSGFPSYPVWANGWLDWSISSDNTNTTLLTHPQYSALAIYCARTAGVFKCPTDRFRSAVQYLWKERVRSVAANPFAGEGSLDPATIDAAYTRVRKWHESVNPAPEQTWLVLDEHPDSINDGRLIPPRTAQWLDLPANYHAGGVGVAFADGRAEIHRWQASVLKYPVTFAGISLTPLPGNDADMSWLRRRTPRKPGMN